MKATDWTVCVKSYDKPEILKRCTLSTLERGGVPKERIIVFVANEEERKRYDSILEGKYKIVVGVLGLAEIDNFITDYFPQGAPLVCMDDDDRKIEFIEKRKDVKSTKEMTDLVKFFDYAFTMCEKLGIHAWGFSELTNKLFCSNGYFAYVSPRPLPGPAFGIFNQKDIKINFGPLDDCERTALILERDRKTLYFSRVIVHNTAEGKEGGVVSLREKKKEYDYYTSEYQEMNESFLKRYGKIFEEREIPLRDKKQAMRFKIQIRPPKDILEDYPTDTYVIKENFGEPVLKKKGVETKKLF